MPSSLVQRIRIRLSAFSIDSGADELVLALSRRRGKLGKFKKITLPPARLRDEDIPPAYSMMISASQTSMSGLVRERAASRDIRSRSGIIDFARRLIILVDLRSFAQYGVQQRRMDFDFSVVVEVSLLPEIYS